MIRPKLHHVTFKTSRMNEMIDWYALVTGSKVNFRNEQSRRRIRARLGKHLHARERIVGDGNLRNGSR